MYWLKFIRKVPFHGVHFESSIFAPVQTSSYKSVLALENDVDQSKTDKVTSILLLSLQCV